MPQRHNSVSREVRAIGKIVPAQRAEGSPPKLAGYAAMFNSQTVIAGYFREQIAPGAFANAIDQDDVRALINHDPNYVLGRNKAGTLMLSEDATGLQFECSPPDTQFARDLLVSVERGDVTQCSFAFCCTTEQWEDGESEADLPLRTIMKCELLDVSIVTYPAYADTSVAVRSMQEWQRVGADNQAAEIAARRARRLRMSLDLKLRSR